MSASSSSSSSVSSLLDEILTAVKKLPTSSTSTNANTFDVAWWPSVPVGHTVFSWGNEEDALSTASSSSLSSSSTTTSSSSSSSSSLSSSASASVAAAADKKDGTDKKDKDNSNKNNKQQQKQKVNKETGTATAAAAAATTTTVSSSSSSSLSLDEEFGKLDIRVGRIVECKRLDGSDKLYIEKIDVGEAEPRQILSGLVKFVPESEMLNATVLVICNLKPAVLAGSKSFGMVLAASNADHTAVELLRPSSDAKPGERVTLDGVDLTKVAVEAEIDAKKKKNAFATVAPLLKTNEAREATYHGHRILTSHGAATSKSLANAQIS